KQGPHAASLCTMRTQRVNNLSVFVSSVWGVRMRKVLAGLVFCAVGALTPMAASAQQAFSWNGFYLGIHGGYGNSDISWVNKNTNWFAFAGQGFDHTPDGLVGGGHLGYNLQMGSWVVGLEGSFTKHDTRDTLSQPQFDLAIHTDVDWT